LNLFRVSIFVFRIFHMALLVTCECGHRLEAADDQAGRQVSCPACGRSLQLPQPYNPLSTSRYLPSTPEDASPPPEPEAPVTSGSTCESCAGSGRCRYCHGAGTLRKPFLERITAAISDAVTGATSFLAGALGADTRPKKFKTKSEKRRAGACPSCEGSGKCFGCEGSGRAPAA
jgi:hypothetical protein